jgi:CelD/BcsL family acetyltransferase involved in cellulose biosynthesis
MGIKIINPILDKRWDSFIEAHPAGTIFHHSVWAKVLRERYACEPSYFIEEDDMGKILAGIPFFRVESLLTGKRLVCLPCSEYCYPLGYSPESVSRLMDAAEKEVLSKKVSFLEVRGWIETMAPGEAGLCETPQYFRHVTNLSNEPEKLRLKLESEKHLKRNLKRAETSRLNIREAQDEKDLREFHKLTIETRRRLCLLPWPYQFIEAIYRHVVLGGYGFLILAELDGRVVAGSMYFAFKDIVLLKFNASRKEYTEYRPNYLVTWKAMERSCKAGYRFFDFGITDSDNVGLLSFKRQWATKETPLHYYYYPAIQGVISLRQNSLAYRTYRAFNKLSPSAISGAAARVMYRHLG